MKTYVDIFQLMYQATKRQLLVNLIYMQTVYIDTYLVQVNKNNSFGNRH